MVRTLKYNVAKKKKSPPNKRRRVLQQRALKIAAAEAKAQQEAKNNNAASPPKQPPIFRDERKADDRLVLVLSSLVRMKGMLEHHLVVVLPALITLVRARGSSYVGGSPFGAIRQHKHLDRIDQLCVLV